MPQYTEYHEAHGMPVSVTKYEPEEWDLEELMEYEERDNEMQKNLAIALNNMLAAKFQIENLSDPNIFHNMRIQAINGLVNSTIKCIQQLQGLTDI